MQWRTLDKNETEKSLGAVKSSTMGSLFSPSTTEVRQCNLPFYQNVFLYRITNFATLPAFSLYYLGDGDHYHYLDGSYDVMEHYNNAGTLVLNAETVLPYLDFYFNNVRLDIGEISIPGDRDRDNALIAFPEDIEISQNAQTRSLYVVTPLYFDGSMMKATIEVMQNGEVHIIDTTMSMQGIDESETSYDRDSSYY